MPNDDERAAEIEATHEVTKKEMRHATELAIQRGDQQIKQLAYIQLGEDAAKAIDLATAIDNALGHPDATEQFPTPAERADARQQSLSFHELHFVARGLQARIAEFLDDDVFIAQ